MPCFSGWCLFVYDYDDGLYADIKTWYVMLGCILVSLSMSLGYSQSKLRLIKCPKHSGQRDKETQKWGKTERRKWHDSDSRRNFGVTEDFGSNPDKIVPESFSIVLSDKYFGF